MQLQRNKPENKGVFHWLGKERGAGSILIPAGSPSVPAHPLGPYCQDMLKGVAEPLGDTLLTPWVT